MNKLTAILKKNRSYSFLDIMWFVGNFLITYFVIGLGIFVSTILSLPEDESLNTSRWIIILGGTLAIVIFTYFRELWAVSKKDARLRDSKVIYDSIGGAIDRLIDIKEGHEDEKPRYVGELLRHVEKIVGVVLAEQGVECGQICSNLMIRCDNPPRLSIEYFGTFLSGRTRLQLSIDPENPSTINPGAPEAFLARKPTYIDNTTSDRYARFFDASKPYRSILSIPIHLSSDESFAVLNIDSDHPSQFVSVDFINKKILPAITPLISLIRLERELIDTEC